MKVPTSEAFASEFSGILPVPSNNTELRSAVLNLIDNEPVAGKVTEGDERLAQFRQILRDLANNQVSLQESFTRVRNDLPRHTSFHGSNNRVFADGWEERLVRTQLSRFYNQAVMEELMAGGETQCFVPHSSSEDPSSPRSSQLAGRNQSIETLHSRLVKSHGQGNFTNDVKIPNHPHCTHVVTRAK